MSIKSLVPAGRGPIQGCDLSESDRRDGMRDMPGKRLAKHTLTAPTVEPHRNLPTHITQHRDGPQKDCLH
jgi:hypothetical protein